jgi:hypothetical protein
MLRFSAYRNAADVGSSGETTRCLSSGSADDGL